MKKIIVLGCLLLTVSGCATSFRGNAKVEGPIECLKICSDWGMDLAGMVAMGDYTNGCICKVKGERLSLADMGRGLLLSSTAVGGVAGIYRQMQD